MSSLKLRISQFWKDKKPMMKIYITCVLAMFSSTFSITMMFPFLPFMVRFLLPELDETKVGQYAGIIASAMFAGRFFGCYLWGIGADHFGRKPVMILSSVLMALTSVGFGFSINFGMAVAMRFIVGAANGMVGTVKTVISESSNDSNQAFGITLISAGWVFGLITGSAVSGVVADPVHQYNISSNGSLYDFFVRFPYSPPCLINCFVCLLAALAAWLLLPETLRKKSKAVALASGTTDERRSSTTDEQHSIDEKDTELDSSLHLLRRSGQQQEEEGITESALSETTFLSVGPSELDQQTHTHTHVCSNGVAGSGGGSPSSNTTPPPSPDLNSSLSASHGNNKEEKKENKKVQGGYRLVHVSRLDRRESVRTLFANVWRRMSVTDSRPGAAEAQLELSQKLQQQHDQRQQLCESSGASNEVEEEEEGERAATSTGEGDLGDSVQVDLLGPHLSRRARAKKAVKKWAADMKSIVCDKMIVLAVAIYCVVSFAIISMDEIYSVWCATDTDLGGIGITLNEIGILLAVVGCLMFPFALTLFPLMERKFGLINTFQMSSVALLVVYILLPNVNVVVGNKVFLWSVLLLLTLINRVSTLCVFSGTSMLVNNSTTFDKMASVNGLAMSLTACFRTVAPTFSGGVFSASLSEKSRSIGFPVNHHLIFILCSVIVLFTVFLVSLLPESIKRQKKK